MKISTKGRYALRLMLDIAAQPADHPVSLRDIAARQQVSIKYLEQIVGLLSKNQLLLSVRGAHGGYSLVKPPEAYTIGEILRVTEKNLAPIACLEPDAPICARADFCATLPFWKGLYETIATYVDGTTLADLRAQEVAQGDLSNCASLCETK